MTLQSLGPNSRHEALIDSACKSPTRLTDAKARRRAILSDKGRKSAELSGSKEGPFRACRTIDKSQDGTVWGQGGFRLRAPFRNLTIRSFLPIDWPASREWFAVIAARYTLSVEGAHPLSSSSCKKVSTWDTSHDIGSKLHAEHQLRKTDHFRL